MRLVEVNCPNIQVLVDFLILVNYQTVVHIIIHQNNEW